MAIFFFYLCTIPQAKDYFCDLCFRIIITLLFPYFEPERRKLLKYIVILMNFDINCKQTQLFTTHKYKNYEHVYFDRIQKFIFNVTDN